MFKDQPIKFNHIAQQFNSNTTSQKNRSNNLVSAFKDKYNYQQMCMIFFQILKQVDIDNNQLQQLQKKLFSLKKIDHELNLRGMAQQSTKTSILKDSSPSHLKLFIKSFQELLKQQNISEEKKNFIKNCIKDKFRTETKTALDAETQCDTRKERFKKDFKRIEKSYDQFSQQDVSFQNLEKVYSSKNQYVDYDIVLNYKRLKTMFGHHNIDQQLPYSPIYNVIYDKSGKLILSADQEGLIKIWSSQTGTLLYNLKGHTGYIEQLHITECNSYLVSCGVDGIRIWCMKTLTCLAVLCFKKTIITVNSFRNQKTNQLSICFLKYNIFYILTEAEFIHNKGKSIQLDYIKRSFRLDRKNSYYNQQSDQVCSIAINEDGYTLVGFQTGQLILFDKKIFMEFQIQDVKYITSKEHSHRVLQIKWHKQGKYFITGSQDGTCRIWAFNLSNLQEAKIKPVAVLKVARGQKRKKKRQPFCNCIAWTCKNNYIIASFGEKNEHGREDQKNGEGQILIFQMARMKVIHELKNKLSYKLDIVNVLEPHPYLQNIAMFCQANGRIVIFDIITCQILNLFQERGFHVEHPQFTLEAIEGKFNPNGDNFVVSTQYGSVTIYGYGIKQFYNLSFTEQFFMNDFQLFIVNEENMTPLLIDTNIDINNLQRGRICNVRKIFYSFEYNIDIPYLMKKGYFTINLRIDFNDYNESKYNVDKNYILMIQNQLEQFNNKEERFLKHYESIQQLCASQLLNQEQITRQKLKSFLAEKINQFNSLSEEKIQLPLSQSKVYNKIEPAVNSKYTRLRKLKTQTLKDQWNQVQQNDQDQYNSEQEEQQIQSQEEDEDNDQQELYHASRRRRSNRRYGQIKEQSQSYQEEIRPTNTRLKRAPEVEIQELNEEYDNEIKNSQNNRKKKRKLHISDQEDEQIYGKSKSKSQQKVINNNYTYTDVPIGSLCKRCEIEQAYQTCKNCKQQFCINCKQYRGKGTGIEFHCFNCLIRQNIYDQQRKISKDLLQKQERSQDIYVPQIGDEVYFFFQGYEQFIMRQHQVLNPKCLQLRNNFTLIEFDNKFELRRVPLCQIKHIEYMYPKKYRQRFLQRRQQQNDHHKDLLILIELETVDSKYTFYVLYVVNFIDFLVRKQLLDYTHQHDLINQINLYRILKTQKEEYQVIQKSPIQKIFSESSWKYLKVRDTSEMRLRRNKNLTDLRINIWKVKQLIPYIPYISCFKIEQTKIMVNNILRLRQSRPQLFQYFYEDVDTKRYTDYNELVEVCISVYKIEKRLKSGYYRSVQSLMFDIKLILRNCITYNGQSYITEQARQLEGELIKIAQSKTYINYTNSQQFPSNDQNKINSNTKSKNLNGNTMMIQHQRQIKQIIPNEESSNHEGRRITRSRNQRTVNYTTNHDQERKIEQNVNRQSRRITRRSNFQE